MILGDSRSPCYARHLGLWMVEPLWFSTTLDAIKAGLYKPITRAEEPVEVDAAYSNSRPYAIDQGVGVIEIAGPLMKGGGSFGEVNSVAIRKSLRAAVNDPDVGAIMLLVDSPGGTVAGTEELAADVRAAAAAKPTFAHFDDLGASAAYWVASQVGPDRLSANSTAEVGSIGTVAVVYDTSGVAAEEGIKVHVISTGAFKGAFTDGAEVLPEHLAYLQERVNELNGHFLEAVKKGRGASAKTVEGWADGKVWIADTARAMGLIDKVQRQDQAMEAAKRAVPRKPSRSSAARAAIAIEEAELN